MAYFLRNFFLYLVLFSATSYGINWAFHHYYAQSLPPAEAEIMPSSLSLAMPSFAMPMRETETGLLLAGMVAQNRRDWQEAWENFSRLNDKYTDNPEFALKAFTLALGNGQYNKAKGLAENLEIRFADKENAALFNTDKYDLVRLFLAFSSIKAQQYDKALEQSRSMAEGALSDFTLSIVENWLNAETNSEALTVATAGLSPLQIYYKAFAAEYAGKKDIALQIMGKVDINVMTPDKIAKIAAFYVRNDKVEKAEDIVRRNLVKYEGSEDLGVLLAEIKKYKKAPMSSPAMQADMNPLTAIAEAFHDFSLVLLGEGAVDSSLLFARMSAYLTSETEGVYLTIGDILKYQGQNEQAIDAYSRIEPRDRAYPQAVAEQVSILGEMGDSELAEQIIRKAIETEQKQGIAETPSFYFMLGNILREKKSYIEALDAYNKAEILGVEQNDGELPQALWPLYYARAVLYDLTDQWDNAEKDLQIALEKFPNSPIILNYLGYAYADRNINLEKAKDMISRAVMAAPNDAYIIDSMGWILFRTGEYKQAVNFLERAAALSPYHMVINDHLGDAYWNVGRKIEAHYMWQRALDYYDETDEEQQRMIDETRRKVEQGLD